MTPLDVQGWRARLEEMGFKPATVYARISRLPSFYEWSMRDPSLGRFIAVNPAQLARPKCPKPYQTESAKALDDEAVAALFRVVREKAVGGDVVGKRDCALLLFFITTVMRRREVIGLRGADVELKKDDLIVKCRVKRGDYVGRAVGEPLVRDALLDYLFSCQHTNALRSDRPLWTRHDKAGRPGAPLSSHAFSKNLKRYALCAGIEKIHVHQTRHTFARIVSGGDGKHRRDARRSGTQEPIGHTGLHRQDRGEARQA